MLLSLLKHPWKNLYSFYLGFYLEVILPLALSVYLSKGSRPIHNLILTLVHLLLLQGSKTSFFIFSVTIFDSSYLIFWLLHWFFRDYAQTERVLFFGATVTFTEFYRFLPYLADSPVNSWDWLSHLPWIAPLFDDMCLDSLLFFSQYF